MGATTLVVATAEPVRDEVEWRWASFRDTAGYYGGYVREWPEGRHAEEARSRWDERSWEGAGAEDTAAALEGYLALHPQGRHAAEARTRAEDLRWEAARAGNSVASFDAYLDEHPAGRYAAEARRRIEGLDWDEALGDDTVSSLEAYLREYPADTHADEARERIEFLVWRDATTEGTVESLTAYLQAYPDGAYADEAGRQIDGVHWDEAESEDTVLSYLRYVRLPGRGQHEAQADRRVAALRRSDEPFREAERQGTREAWNEFLKQFQGHRRTAAARGRLGELVGANIVQLVADGKIEVDAEGADITRVSMRIRRKVSRSITVKIPVGTFFVANGSFQNMVATEPLEIELDGDEWEEVSVAAACANRTRAIPRDGDGFTVVRSPQHAELQRVVPKIRDEEFAVRQAAVWIITDNASFADLGILIYGPEQRVIEADHAATAMQLVDRTGIEITSKAIWRDRSLIRMLVTRDELRRWLDRR